ncbi:GDSL-type esterase/lipase family protein [Fundicoccus sp. Sow4_H7]|uniref:GDSL-type esterase/lipase family protein n=1 Tax=Fundicoccus sp. Sow4_H7 TaxID=3438784 RepID=UPI003F8F71D8
MKTDTHQNTNDEWVTNYSTPLNQTLINDLLDDTKINSWLFLGGKETQPDFNQLGFARNYIGHFEEAYRWQYITENERSRERFVINGGKTGQNLADVVANWQAKTKAYDHKVTAYLFGAEDEALYANNATQLEEDLHQLAELALAQRNHTGVLVLQLPFYRNLRNLVLQAINSLGQTQKDHLIIVDHFILSQDENWMEALTLDGDLNTIGHLRLAKHLLKTVFGFHQNVLTYSGLKATQIKNNPLDSVHPHYQQNAVAHSQAIQLLIQSKQPLKWLFMGDSITHGALHTDGYESVPQLFEKFLHHDLERPDDLVFNMAVSGATTLSTLKAIDERFDAIQADIVILMLGTNDLKFFETSQEYEHNYRLLLDHIQARQLPLVLRSLTPAFKEDWLSLDDKLNDYYEITQKLAHEYQAAFVDQLHIFENLLNQYPYLRLPYYGMFNDGIHPAFRGQMLMAKQLVSSLGIAKPNHHLMQLDFSLEFNEHNVKESLKSKIINDSIHIDAQEIVLQINDYQKSYAKSNEIKSTRPHMVALPEGMIESVKQWSNHMAATAIGDLTVVVTTANQSSMTIKLSDQLDIPLSLFQAEKLTLTVYAYARKFAERYCLSVELNQGG